MKALICDKWELDLGFNWEDEFDEKESQRSYIHYLVTRPEWIATKCWATEWLFSDMVDTGLSLVEYCAGIGIQSTIAQKILKPSEHLVMERDPKCVQHLKQIGFNAVEADANQSMFEYQNFDVKFADFPCGSSAYSIQKNWKGWLPMFDSKPELVVWTDTAVAYPASRYGHKYAALFGAEKVESWDEYVREYSNWLWDTQGYCIGKAAFRGRNAVYLAAVPRKVEPEIRRFSLKECSDGFVLLGN